MKSKWLNQVLIQISDPAALAKINSFTFVKSSSAIAARVMVSDNAAAISKNKMEEESYSNKVTQNSYRVSGNLGTADINYGSSFQQIHIHRS